jgi:hypothetical protein
MIHLFQSHDGWNVIMKPRGDVRANGQFGKMTLAEADRLANFLADEFGLEIVGNVP